MKTNLTKVLITTSVILAPLLSETASAVTPVSQLSCKFQGQERRFMLKDNPNEAVAYVKLESDGICAAGTAYLDENNRAHFNIAMYETCFVDKLAQTQSDFPVDNRKSLAYQRPSDGKLFMMGCKIERYSDATPSSYYGVRIENRKATIEHYLNPPHPPQIIASGLECQKKHDYDLYCGIDVNPIEQTLTVAVKGQYAKIENHYYYGGTTLIAELQCDKNGVCIEDQPKKSSANGKNIVAICTDQNFSFYQEVKAEIQMQSESEGSGKISYKFKDILVPVGKSLSEKEFSYENIKFSVNEERHHIKISGTNGQGILLNITYEPLAHGYRSEFFRNTQTPLRLKCHIEQNVDLSAPQRIL